MVSKKWVKKTEKSFSPIGYAINDQWPLWPKIYFVRALAALHEFLKLAFQSC